MLSFVQQETLEFADKVAKWPIQRIIPAHFKVSLCFGRKVFQLFFLSVAKSWLNTISLQNNLKYTGKDYRAAFSFLEASGVPAGLPKPLASDFQTLSDAEAGIAVIDFTTTGTSLQINLLGFGGSFTRSEIVGGILAVASPHPTHIGTDSAAFLQKANMLHQLIQQNKVPKKPWALQVDGDLWKTYWQHAKAKGTCSIRVSKV